VPDWKPLGAKGVSGVESVIDAISFSCRVPNHCPAKLCAGLGNIDDGYVHGAGGGQLGD
jgi:hypothetical protein